MNIAETPSIGGQILRWKAQPKADLSIGVADASMAVLAARYRTIRILTLDHRHVGATRAANGSRFEVLPTI